MLDKLESRFMVTKSTFEYCSLLEAGSLQEITEASFRYKVPKRRRRVDSQRVTCAVSYALTHISSVCSDRQGFQSCDAPSRRFWKQSVLIFCV